MFVGGGIYLGRFKVSTIRCQVITAASMKDAAACSLVETDRCFRRYSTSIIIALIMEVVSTSETSVNLFEPMRCNILETAILCSFLNLKTKLSHVCAGLQVYFKIL
jgi:hypothetical protein